MCVHKYTIYHGLVSLWWLVLWGRWFWRGLAWCRLARRPIRGRCLQDRGGRSGWQCVCHWPTQWPGCRHFRSFRSLTQVPFQLFNLRDEISFSQNILLLQIVSECAFVFTNHDFNQKYKFGIRMTEKNSTPARMSFQSWPWDVKCFSHVVGMRMTAWTILVTIDFLPFDPVNCPDSLSSGLLILLSVGKSNAACCFCLRLLLLL